MAIMKRKPSKESSRINVLKQKIRNPTSTHNVNFLMDTKLHKKLKMVALGNDETLTEIFIRAAQEYVK